MCSRGSMSGSCQSACSTLGFVSHEELSALYKNAVALVFPSFFGPDNLPPLEAFCTALSRCRRRYSGRERAARCGRAHVSM
jgi:glycosyltransferase involved in cell wall biosynthesis